MKQLIFAVTTGLLAVILITLGLSRSLATTGPVDLVLTSPYDGHEVEVGETVQFMALLTNTDAVARSYIYALTIPQGMIFVDAGANLQRNDYEVGAADTIKSLTWIGNNLGPQQRQTFTFTLQVAAAGMLPGGDIPVVGMVFDGDSGEELARQSVTLDWPGTTVHLPLVLRNSQITPQPTSTPTATPTPTDTPTPTPTTSKLPPTIAGVLQSQDADYNAALAGSGYVAGGDALNDKEPHEYPVMSLSLVQCNFMELVYMINRQYLEYDTSSVADFSSAYLVFRNNTAYPGPPAHAVEIYQGAWTQLVSGTNRIDPANWNTQGTLIETVPGNTETLPVTVTVPMSGFINAGEITKLALKTSTEGTAPEDNSCFGGPNPGLGASVSLPYLYIEP